MDMNRVSQDPITSNGMHLEIHFSIVPFSQWSIKVKVIDTTFVKYRNYKRKGRESLTLLYKSYDGKKAAIHFGENNPWNWMPKFIQMKLRARGDLPKTHIIKGWEN